MNLSEKNEIEFEMKMMKMLIENLIHIHIK